MVSESYTKKNRKYIFDQNWLGFYFKNRDLDHPNAFKQKKTKNQLIFRQNFKKSTSKFVGYFQSISIGVSLEIFATV